MALSDYMPYGAPELIDGAPERMARSTLFASLAVALMVSALGAILAREVARSVPVEPKSIRDTLIMINPLMNPPKVPSVRVASPIVSPNATPIPTPDHELIKDEPTAPAPPTGDANGDAHAKDTPSGGGIDGQVLPAADPDPGIFIYADVYPELVSGPNPVYPDLAREAGVEGSVVVLMLVGLDGHVTRAIIAPHGSVPMLDEAALVAARACVFTPALTNKHPVKVWVRRVYRFSLH